jgi:hypothetical protein
VFWNKVGTIHRALSLQEKARISFSGILGETAPPSKTALYQGKTLTLRQEDLSLKPETQMIPRGGKFF